MLGKARLAIVDEKRSYVGHFVLSLSICLFVRLISLFACMYANNNPA